MTSADQIKINEASVLKTFKKEIPSVYYSDKSEKDFLAYYKNAEYFYRNNLKFPPEMFKGKKLIDFGAGTGENTVYLAKWGANCTLVEMNDQAQSISKDVFKKYLKNYEDHTFINSSIFDYDNKDDYQSYDIVHCRGVLSHTADKEKAFSIINKYLKPGGYIIFGDPNKAGGFQNMLQRIAIYTFATDWEKMIKVSEEFFSDDIDRSQKYVNRTRNTIIFDRWVVQCQDDPSVKEVLSWFEKNNLAFYSAYPKFELPLMSDSAFHYPKFSMSNLKDVAGVLSETFWLSYKDDDHLEMPKALKDLNDYSKSFEHLTSYVSKSDVNLKINNAEFETRLKKYLVDLNKLEFLDYVKINIKNLMTEVLLLISHLETKNYEETKKFIKQTKYLFKGATGVRHVDFIGYKNNED
jgi:2-polyprenyl-3-methyl-5-hydroxy-6-metoxy-1,4-benzoquinol methylase